MRKGEEDIWLRSVGVETFVCVITLVIKATTTKLFLFVCLFVSESSKFLVYAEEFNYFAYS